MSKASKAKQVQGKVFRGEKTAAIVPPSVPKSGSDPSLTIQIPRPSLSSSTQPAAPPPPKLKQNVPEEPPKEQSDVDNRTYRERLLEQLGHDFHGVEKYRLEQDEKKTRHWKKWGPYLSERQWVCPFYLLDYDVQPLIVCM